MTSPDKAFDGNSLQIPATLRPKCDFLCKMFSVQFISGINPSIFIQFLFCKSVTTVEVGLLSPPRIVVYMIVSFEWSQ